MQNNEPDLMPGDVPKGANLINVKILHVPHWQCDPAWMQLTKFAWAKQKSSPISFGKGGLP